MRLILTLIILSTVLSACGHGGQSNYRAAAYFQDHHRGEPGSP